MPSLTVRVLRVEYPPPGGFAITWASGPASSFANLTALRAFAEGSDGPPGQLLRRIAVGWWLHRCPDGSDDSAIEGRSFVLDLAQNRAILEVS